MRQLILGITKNCNLSCLYCIQEHSSQYMSFDTAKKAIDLFSKTLSTEDKKVQISFYGGEPLLCKNIIREAVKYAEEILVNNRGIKVIYEITTNGLLLDECFLDFADEHNIVIALSHDGLSQSYTRLNLEGFPVTEKVNQALNQLVSRYPSTPIMMTVHPEYVNYLSDSIEFFYERGIRKINFTLASGYKANWNNESFSILSDELNKVTETYIKYNQSGLRYRILPIEGKIRLHIHDKSDANMNCKLCDRKLLVDYDGKIYPCTHFIGLTEFNVGDIFTQIDYKKLNEIESKRIAPNECDLCSYKTRCSHRCACANHGYNNSLNEPSALQCEYERLIINLADRAANILINENNQTFIREIYS